MKIYFYGTRGSVPVNSDRNTRYGGNTTCLWVTSRCIPSGYALVVDAGSGFVPLSRELLQTGVSKLALLLTHYHHDHTQGIPLAPHTFAGKEVKVWGPRDHRVGPHDVLSAIMKKPIFPVDFAMVKRRFKVTPLDSIGTQVLIIHPVGGFHLLPAELFARREAQGETLVFANGKYPINECLVVKMYQTSHPDLTVSYRFEERPTGKVFVFLTDHEDTSALSADLIAHVDGADLLVQDSQYSENAYKQSVGFGHGTPQYCVDVAISGGVKCLGLTHHDPGATDKDIDERLHDALSRVAAWRRRTDLKIFACGDYQAHQV